MSESEICKFYDNQRIFITGGTGFMGKVLIEKLLRSTNVALIYILVRNKRGQDASARFEGLFDNKLFEKLKQQQPNFKSRIIVVSGDSTFPNLGLSQEIHEELTTTVNIVFHAAATVRFDVSIEEAYEVNVRATANVIELCKQMKHLKAFVHVSTAYSNCNEETLHSICNEEAFFSHVNYEVLVNILEKTDATQVEKLISRFLEKWPNTYTFTKALAEVLVKDKGRELPAAIFRPAIITATHKEPFAGWIDSYGGATSVIAGLSVGFLRVLPLDKNLKAELVPVDMCVSAVIAVAWAVGAQNTHKSIPIYNFVSSVDNPISWFEIIHILKVQFSDYPLRDLLWTPKIIPFKKWEPCYSLLIFLYHYLPAVITDFARVLCLKKPQMISKYRKLSDFNERMRFVTQRNWKFTNGNTRDLWDNMNQKDQELFPFDLVGSLHWLKYIRDYYLGIRVYIFKDPMDTIAVAQTKANRLKFTHNFFKFVLRFIGTSFLWIILQKVISYYRKRKSTLLYRI